MSKKYIVISACVLICTIGLILYYLFEQSSNNSKIIGEENYHRNDIKKTDEKRELDFPEQKTTDNRPDETELVFKAFLEKLKENKVAQNKNDTTETEEPGEDDDSTDSEYFTGDVPDSRIMFNSMDLDHDGVVTFPEYKGIGTQQMFDMLDLDGDGNISPDEMDYIINDMYDEINSKVDNDDENQNVTEDDIKDIFNSIDTDENEQITKNEFIASIDQINFLYSENNNSLSGEDHTTLEGRYKQWDIDGNGIIIFSEFFEMYHTITKR